MEKGTSEKCDLNNNFNEGPLIDLGGSLDVAWTEKGSNSRYG